MTSFLRIRTLLDAVSKVVLHNYGHPTKSRLTFKKYFRRKRQNLELTCGKEPLRKMAVCMMFRIIPVNTGSGTGARVVQDLTNK